MRATVEVYENNAGGIFVAVFGQNGLKKLFEDVLWARPDEVSD